MRNIDDKKKQVIFIIVVCLVAVVIGLAIRATRDKNDPVELNYADLIEMIQTDEVKELETTRDSHSFFVTLKQDDSLHVVTVPNIDEFTSFVGQEIKNGSDIEFIVNEPSSFASAVVSLLSSILTLTVMITFLRRMTGGGNMKITPVKSNVSFEDVAGIDAEREQLEEVVEFLRDPNKYHRIGARIPKGILVEGDPGTGKTLLAKAIAGEAGVPFFQVNGSSFEEKFVGVGASRVRKLFEEAKKHAPSIIFIDELDSVAQQRYGSKTNYSEQTLNQLLSEMDGFETSSNVIVIAATNHIEVLDSAVTRPGRFDRKLHIPRPNLSARVKILEVHSRNKQIDESVSFEEIAKKTVGFTGADLENILNEAAIYAVNHQKSCISVEDIDEAIARVIAGLKNMDPTVTEEEKRLTAVHEAGHALVSAVVRPNIANFGISIIQRGSAGGYNFFGDSFSLYKQKKELIATIQVYYAGRIAEEIVLQEISAGASNDYQEASKIAYQMVNHYGMSGKYMTQIRGNDSYNELIERENMMVAERICEEAYSATKNVIIRNRRILDSLTETLMEKESLSQDEVAEFFAQNRVS